MTDKNEIRRQLEEDYGKVWTTDEMTSEFEVLGFAMGLCVVRRREGGERGTLDFTHMPRFYFDFQPA